MENVNSEVQSILENSNLTQEQIDIVLRVVTDPMNIVPESILRGMGGGDFDPMLMSMGIDTTDPINMMLMGMNGAFGADGADFDGDSSEDDVNLNDIEDIKMKKISKSDFTDPNSGDLTFNGKIQSLTSEARYWKTRCELICKYGIFVPGFPIDNVKVDNIPTFGDSSDFTNEGMLASFELQRNYWRDRHVMLMGQRPDIDPLLLMTLQSAQQRRDHSRKRERKCITCGEMTMNTKYIPTKSEIMGGIY